jgi:hypothetical protein
VLFVPLCGFAKTEEHFWGKAVSSVSVTCVSPLLLYPKQDGVFQLANLFEEKARQRFADYRFSHAASSSGLSQKARNM